jgi:hypothetical protein
MRNVLDIHRRIIPLFDTREQVVFTVVMGGLVHYLGGGIEVTIVGALPLQVSTHNRARPFTFLETVLGLFDR